MANKPQLRGLGMRAYGIGLAASLIASAGLAVYWKINVVEKRKKTYAEFYDNLDDDAAFESMKKAGIFKGFEPQ